MMKYKGFDDPEVEVVQDPFTLDIDIVQAIRIIQKNDRGRQGRQRIMLILKSQLELIAFAEIQAKIRKGEIVDQADNKENDSCVFLQKRIRGIIARKKVEKYRQEEMEFLGMVRKKKPIDDRNEPIKKMDQI